MKTKKLIAMLMALLLCASPIVIPAAADADTSATVSFTAQNDGSFIFAPQLDVAVSAGLAESYGYADSVSGVSALDVLVKAHEIKYGDAFSAQTKDSYLTVPKTGYISKLFGEETYYSGFLVNGMYPHDGTTSQWGGYNGTTVTTQQVTDNDTVQFFIYEDKTNCSDEISWFCYGGSDVDKIEAQPGQSVKLTLKSAAFMYAGNYIDRAALRAVGSSVGGAQLAWINMADTSLSPIANGVTANDGTVTLTLPSQSGTYYITAYIPDGTTGEPLIMPLTEIVVSEDNLQADSCALTSFTVASFDSNPDSLELTPNFDSNVTEYSVPIVEFPFMDLPVFRSVYIKAAAASDDAVITARCGDVSVDVTSGDSNWKLLNGALTGGKNNVLEIIVAASNNENAKTKKYSVIIPMKPEANTAPMPVNSAAQAEICVGDTYSADLTQMFTDADEVDRLTYKVSVNGGAAVSADASYRFVPAEKGTYSLVFTANDGTADSAPCTVTLEVLSYTEITVPTDAKLFIGENVKGAWSYNYFVPFIKYSPASSKDNGDGTTTYFYKLVGNNDSNIFNYRISGDNFITRAGTFVKTDGYSLTVTEEDLKTDGKTKTTVDRSPASNGGFNTGDIYLNINPQGYLKLDHIGDTYQLVNLRNWEIVNNTTENYIIEPDYHYSVVGLNGQADDSVVIVNDSGLVSAVGSGTAIVIVTYDAINAVSFAGGPFFGAIWPENTGVFVVSVGSSDSGVVTGMTINEELNSSSAGDKLALSSLDSELDVIYFTGDAGSYTFTPATDGVNISVANPTVTDKLNFSGFKSIAANDDGSITIPLTEGRNIVCIEKDGSVQYQVVTAKKLSYTINNGEPVAPGDNVSIVFDTVYHPVNKLAGVYNSNAAVVYKTCDGKTVGSNPNQYTFASDEQSQKISKYIERTEAEEYGYTTLSYNLADALKIPDEWNKDIYTLSGGALLAYGYGDPYGNHRGITSDGKAPNDNYNVKEAFFGALPDIEIPIVATTSALSSISLDTASVQTTYYEGDVFNTDNLTVTASYEDGTAQIATNYTVSPEQLSSDTEYVTITYRGKSAIIPVTVTPLKALSISITSQPVKMVYTAGETFNPTGMTVTVTYNSGKTSPTSDYSYSPNRELAVSDTEMTVTYTGADASDSLTSAAVPITVNSAPQGSSGSNTISVYLTLYGDSKHGTPTVSTGTHTLKTGNLTEWIGKKAVTVKAGSCVLDVLEKALSLEGIPYSNPTGSYVESIRGLEQLDNGNNSGWMYTYNGKYSDLAVNKQTVKNGDVIVFHYTDDYTLEYASTGSNNSTGKNTSKTGSTAVSVENTQAVESDEIFFDDVKKDDWHYESVKYVYDKKLMNGTGNGFEPDGKMTRAMLVTVLYRLENARATDSEIEFDDVSAGEWYYDAVLWAAENGVVKGVSDSEFAPDDNITREQIATVIYRYAMLKGYDGTPSYDLTEYADSAQISEWASHALSWANGAELINGMGNGILAPKSDATRAQVAAIFMRFCEMIAQ